MLSPVRIVKAGYVLVLAVVCSLLLRPSPTSGQFRGTGGNNMPPAPVLPQLNNQMSDDTAGWLIYGRMAGMGGGMSMGGGMMGMGGGMMGMGGGMMGMMGMGGGMNGMMGMGGMSMMGMGGMNMMGGMMGMNGMMGMGG